MIQTTTMTIRIASWDSNGLAKWQTEFKHFLLRKKIHIFGVTETRMRPATKMQFQNYQVHRKDNDNGQGGAAVFINNTVSFQQIQHPAPTQREAIGIKLADNIHIIFMCNRPKVNLTNKILDDLFGISRKVMIIGDLNARHATWSQCARNNASGSAVHRYALNNNSGVLH